MAKRSGVTKLQLRLLQLDVLLHVSFLHFFKQIYTEYSILWSPHLQNSPLLSLMKVRFSINAFCIPQYAVKLKQNSTLCPMHFTLIGLQYQHYIYRIYQSQYLIPLVIGHVERVLQLLGEALVDGDELPQVDEDHPQLVGGDQTVVF